MDTSVDEQTRRLVHVRYAAAALGEAEHNLRETVRAAREMDATWEQVGEALGLSAEGARERYDHG